MRFGENEQAGNWMRALVLANAGRVSIAAVLTVMLVCISPAQAEFIETNELYGFVAAGVSSGTVVSKDTRFSFNYAVRDNTSSASNTVTRLAKGHYRVDFPHLAQPTGVETQPDANGIVEITGFNVLGSLNVRCKPSTWYVSSGDTLSVEVWCFKPSGVTWDSFFLVNYLKRWTDFIDPMQDGAYVYVSNATSALGTTYTVTDPHSWNSMQQAITVTRVGTGEYDLYFVGQRPGYPFTVPNGCSDAPPYSGGTVEVTAVGSGPEFCKVWQWGDTGTDTYVGVNCFDVNGNPADSRFNVKYSNSYPIGSPNSGFGWVDGVNTAVGGSSNADPSFSAELTAISDGNSCGHYEFTGVTQTEPVLSHGGTGMYGVRFPQMGGTPHSTADNNPSSGPASAMFTSYGDGADYCNFAGWSYSVSSGMTLFTQCFGANGALKDVLFDVSYAYEGWRVQ
ncbi:MAG TPA: hypothetical protein VIF57_12110 [Polyangia bacterium]|jgi:hypothetical protein